MKYKVGDIVITRYGTGKIVEINEDIDFPYLVYHFNWKYGHNGTFDVFKKKYDGNHCWWFEESDLCSTKTISNIKMISVGNEPLITSINTLPKKYIINKGATILFWNDGTKTIVKKAKHDEYNKRLGFLTAYFQKTSGLSKSKANKYLDSLVDEDDYERKEKSN